MLRLIDTGSLLIAVILSVSADDLSNSLVETAYETLSFTNPLEVPDISSSDARDLETDAEDMSTDSVALSERSTEFAPMNLVISSDVASPSHVALSFGDTPFPSVPGLYETPETTLDSVNDLHPNQISKPDDSEPGHSPEVVIIAVCVSLISLVVVILSIAMSFVIRRRMRRKAYLRVKHASQTELAIHYVKNTPALAAARDSAMEQLFQSLASMNPDGQNDFQIAISSDDQCLSTTTDGVVPEMISGKNRKYSRSLPSLKNLNAHEEALNCNFVNMPCDVGRTKGRSRSFTEKALNRIDPMCNKSALRSHSEKANNRLAVVSLLSPGKRFTKTNNKSNRRSAPSFSRLAKFNLFKVQPSKGNQGSAKEQVPLARVESQSVTKPADFDLVQSKHYSASLSDFELPNVSPILEDMNPMLTALQAGDNVSHDLEPCEKKGEIRIHSADIRIFRDVEPSAKTSMEEIQDEHLCRRSNNLYETEKTTTKPALQQETKRKSGSVNNVGQLKLELLNHSA